MQIDQPQLQSAQLLVRQRQHGPVEPQLCPVDSADLVMHGGGVGARGLYLFYQPLRRIPAIDAAAHLELAERCLHAMFAHIGIAALLLPLFLPSDTLLGKRGRPIANMQIAAVVDELGEIFDANLHDTGRKRSTRTGRPRSCRAWIQSR